MSVRARCRKATLVALLVANPQGGHSGFWFGLRNGAQDATMIEEAVTVVVHWLDVTLNDNARARSYFVGSCTLCSQPGWTVERKGF